MTTQHVVRVYYQRGVQDLDIEINTSRQQSYWGDVLLIGKKRCLKVGLDGNEPISVSLARVWLSVLSWHRSWWWLRAAFVLFGVSAGVLSYTLGVHC